MPPPSDPLAYAQHSTKFPIGRHRAQVTHLDALSFVTFAYVKRAILRKYGYICIHPEIYKSLGRHRFGCYKSCDISCMSKEPYCVMVDTIVFVNHF